MDNNSYEQSFSQNIKSSTPLPSHKAPSSPLLAIIIILVVSSIVLQVVSLVFLSKSYNSLAEVVTLYEDDMDLEDESETFNIYTYNENDALKSMTETCQDETYGYYIFENNGLYQLYDNNPQNENSIDVGTYRFADNNTITLNSATQGTRNLAFNKTTLTEGEHTFTCLNATANESEE